MPGGSARLHDLSVVVGDGVTVRVPEVPDVAVLSDDRVSVRLAPGLAGEQITGSVRTGQVNERLATHGIVEHRLVRHGYYLLS